jgi:hypothetical protein
VPRQFSTSRARARVARAAVVLALLVPGARAFGQAAPPAGTPAVGASRAVDLVGAANWDRYFPFRLGDSWTYDWRTEGPLSGQGTPVHTRMFDGTSFVGDQVGYKLVSDDGAYHLYTYEQGVLAIHSSSEAGRLFYYDPPVIVAAPDMRIGEPRTIAQTDSGRTWTTTILGLEAIDVPLGHFANVLAIRVEMRGADLASVATHYFAPDVGLVAYRYELRDAQTRDVQLDVRADLKLARLAGVNVTRLDDVAKLKAAAAAVVAEDRDLRETLKRALARRYTWDASFQGFKGEAQLVEAGRPPVRAKFVVGPDLSVKVEASDPAVRAALTNEISSFVTLRKDVPFDLAYADTTFVKSSTTADGVLVVTAPNDPLATTYALRNGRVVEVSRSLGRVSYSAQDRSTVPTEDGRDLAIEYDLVYRSTADGAQIAVEHTRDSYTKLGKYWVPSGRRVARSTAGQGETTRELVIENVTAP